MSDRAQRTLIWLIAVSLVGGTAVALRYWRAYQPLVSFSAPLALPPDVVLRFENVRVTGRSAGRPAWTLAADRIDTSPGRTRITFTGSVSATFLEHGRVEADVRSPGAAYDAMGRVLTVDGGIVCHVRDTRTGSQEMEIVSPDLQWQVGGRTVHANGPVRATLEGGDTLTGDQMNVDLRTRDLNMKNVDVEFSVKDDVSTSPFPAFASFKS